MPMLTLRRAADRGHFNHGWLDTYHTFSFSEYYDPAHMSFRSLRVMNEDRVAPGMGFGMHGHRDMEIVTIVLSGALQHKDSLGNGEVLRPGEFQRMSAGSGIRHSEFNPSETEAVHLYQIWLTPRATGLPPSYEQKPFDPAARQNQWQLVASPDAAAGSLTIQQDARIYLANLPTGGELNYELPPGRHAWLQVIAGAGKLNELDVAASDGVAISDETRLQLTAASPLEVMLFDLP
jgi:redox-sensitive bicupin YhaK (pirin superfamily)